MRLSLSTPVSFTPYNYLTVTDMLVIYEGTIFQCNRKLKGSIPPSVSFYSDIYIFVYFPQLQWWQCSMKLCDNKISYIKYCIKYFYYLFCPVSHFTLTSGIGCFKSATKGEKREVAHHEETVNYKISDYLYVYIGKNCHIVNYNIFKYKFMNFICLPMKHWPINV